MQNYLENELDITCRNIKFTPIKTAYKAYTQILKQFTNENFHNKANNNKIRKATRILSQRNLQIGFILMKNLTDKMQYEQGFKDKQHIASQIIKLKKYDIYYVTNKNIKPATKQQMLSKIAHIKRAIKS